MEFIKKLVEEMVIMEITARIGPRTGGFEFPEEQLQAIDIFANELLKKGISFKKPIRQVFYIKNPINGKNTRIPFLFYFDANKNESAYFQPYQNASGGTISINMARYKPSSFWSRSIISHELTHLFDKTSGDAAFDATGEDYYSAPRERHAFAQQFISEMVRMAKEIVTDIENKKETSVLLAKTLVKKPQYLFRNVANRDSSLRNVLSWYIEDQEFMKKLLKASYSIIQAYLVPAIQAHDEGGATSPSSSE